VNTEIVVEKIKLSEIIATTQDANITAEKKAASESNQICIICMHYLSVVETNINFRR